MVVNKKIIQDFNNKISIYELVINCGISLKKTGKNFMALCPFHQEKTPSFSVSEEKNIALCMSCRRGGRPVKFYEQFKNISTQEAIMQLSQKFNLILPRLEQKSKYEHLYEILEETQQHFQKALSIIIDDPNIENHPLKNYLQKRKLNKKLIKEFKLGYAHRSSDSLKKYLLNKNYHLENILKLGLITKKEEKYYDFFQDRIIFPITDIQGKTVGFSGRTLSFEENSNNPKYLLTSESDLFKKNNLIYRFFEHQKHIQENKELILCEGFFDVIAFFKVGIKNVVASLGISLSPNQINLLKKKIKTILIAFDGDKAGQNSSLKIAQLLNKNNFQIKILFLPKDVDPDQYINIYQQKDHLDNFFIKDKIKDYILFQIEKFKKQKMEPPKLEKEIFHLLENQDQKTKEYYAIKIFESFQISVDFDKNYLSYESNNIQNLAEIIIKRKDNQQKIQSKGIYEEISKKEKKNITNVERDILNDFFLARDFLKSVKNEIMTTNIHPDFIELMDKIEEYYNQYNEQDKGINIDHFICIYNDFFKNLVTYHSVYDSLMEIKKNPLFRKKKRIQHREDILMQLKIKNQKEKTKEIEELLNKMFEKFNNESDPTIKKKIILQIAAKQKELQEMKISLKGKILK